MSLETVDVAAKFCEKGTPKEKEILALNDQKGRSSLKTSVKQVHHSTGGGISS